MGRLDKGEKRNKIPQFGSSTVLLNRSLSNATTTTNQQQQRRFCTFAELKL